MVGTAVGSVPDDTPMVPLARDLASTQRRLRLKLEDRTLELDLRRPTQLARSHLLHRLTLLEVPWGQLVEGRGAAGDLPRDVAAALGARAGRTARGAQRVRHHGRGGRRGLRHPAGR